jgi:hypothetical protein
MKLHTIKRSFFNARGDSPISTKSNKHETTQFKTSNWFNTQAKEIR